MNRASLGAAATGTVVGLLSTFPIALGPVPSLLVWTLAGIALGYFTQDGKQILWSGVLYGIFLSIFFLFSRFGGSADKILAYSLFVAALSVVGALAGIVVVFVGSKIPKKKNV